MQYVHNAKQSEGEKERKKSTQVLRILEFTNILFDIP